MFQVVENMNDNIDKFIISLEEHLKDVPEDVRTEAVEYYREYIGDACESGEDPDTVLKRLGPVGAIAGAIKMEISIQKARNHPGIRNYGGVLKNTFRIVSKPVYVLFLSLFTLLSGSVFITFFLSAFAFFIGAVVALFAVIYEAVKMPAGFILEITGTLGIGLFTFGILMLLAIGFYKLAVLFIKISVSIIGRNQKKTVLGTREAEERKNIRSKPAVIVLTVLSVFGLVLFSVSGLPVRYFNIFNSAKPDNIEIKSYNYNAGEINAISVVSAHSEVSMTKGAGEGIEIVYHRSDWLDCEVVTEGENLYFVEKSNGRLPFFPLVSLHESLTKLEIRVPDGVLKMADIESTGGHVKVLGLSANIHIETLNGRVEIDAGFPDNANIHAKAVRGRVFFQDQEVGHRTDQGTEYIVTGESDKTIEAVSKNGDIHIR